MLVISRKRNESIVINDTIRVTVVEIRGDKVRLRISAPCAIPVHRQEVYDAIHGCRNSAPSSTDHAISITPAILSWNDGIVPRLAEAAYDNCVLPSGTLDNTRLLILADALDEAGCTDEQVLT